MLRIECPPSKNELHSQHPNCPHGPTLLFHDEKEGKSYFACAAFREKRDCSFHLPLQQLTERHLNREYNVDIKKYRKMQDKISSSQHEKLYYCRECNEAVLPTKIKHHNHQHTILTLTDAQLSDPTTFLKPLDNDKAQAQYFFDNKALNFFSNCFKDLGINKVVCIGAPRLHAHLRNNYDELLIQSYLLDFDYRFYYFYSDSNFAWYNMCNNHFFDEKQEFAFIKFLQCEENDRLLLFLDPPFGCRTEPIAETLRQLTALFNRENNLPHRPLPIFWIFPYFSGTYIQNVLPAMEMCDYKVNYTNHVAYSDSGVKGNRKLGSPVRIFTNVPLELIRLPVVEGYKYCELCKIYTALENRHCKACGKCPAKNGSTYRHCDLCGCCVKPNYIHCGNCRRCTQIEGHNCQEYQQKQRCWICTETGHIERQCAAWQKASKRFVMSATDAVGNVNKINCLLCGRAGHNERCCPMRNKYIEETTFLGKTSIKLK